MLNANEGWAVGVRMTATRKGKALALHYRNGEWVETPVPSIDTLFAVDVVGPDHAWAGGDGFFEYTPAHGWQRVGE
jgi:hypothetical protein